MTDAVTFRAERMLSRFHDPRQGFELSTVESEVRFDPLTGDTGRICHFAFETAPPSDFESMIEASRGTCPFCPDKVMEVTPRFDEALVPGGRLVHGEAVLFPNMFPYDDHSAVCAASREHFLPIDGMPEEPVIDSIGAARDFFALLRGAREADAAPAYGLLTWNYMPPAGASVIHPHMQVIHTTRPGNTLRRQLGAEGEWRERHGRKYAADLLAAEEGGPRWVGWDGPVGWMVSFAPAGLLGDCLAVFPECATLADLTDRHVAHFASGLSKALRFFSTRGVWSFNLVFYPDAEGSDAGRHWMTARLLPRLYVNPAMHVTDVAYMQLLLDERFSMILPETTAEGLRAAFAA